MQCDPHYNEMLSSYEINPSITTLWKPYNAFGDLLDFLKSSLLTRKSHHENNVTRARGQKTMFQIQTIDRVKNKPALLPKHV